MPASPDDFTRYGSDRGPAVYFGYCTRSRQYRMMDLPEYLSNVQRGMTAFLSGASSMVTDGRSIYDPASSERTGSATRRTGRDCCCQCCVCDADILVHGRCGEIRLIPVTFENDTRRERPVKLTLEKFVTAGGRDLGWNATLSETEFTLRGCEEHTVIITVPVRCKAFTAAGQPAESDNTAAPGANAVDARFGSVDRCEVGYATLRADGCLVRPIVVALAVLPDECDAYRHPCGCGCCH